MGECIITRRGGEKSGRFAYEVKQFETLTQNNTLSSTALKNVTIGTGYYHNPTTNAFTLTGIIFTGNIDGTNQDLMLNHYARWDAYGSIRLTTALTYAPSEGYPNEFINLVGTMYYGQLVRKKIVIADSAQYLSDTAVGEEIRKDL